MATRKMEALNVQPRAMRLSPEARRQQLLDCAIKCFAEYGLATANHGMVASAAKVSVPSVFSYFNTREALVDGVLTEVERLYTTTLATAVADEQTALEALVRLSRELTDAVEKYPDHARIMIEWSVSVRSSIWPRYLKVYRRMNKMLAKVIERGQREGTFRPDLDPGDEAAILHAGSTALIMLMETGASPARMDQFQRSMIQPILLPQYSLEKDVANKRQDRVKTTTKSMNRPGSRGGRLV